MRTVRLEHKAEESLTRDQEKCARFNEVYQALEWLLANNPKQGVRLHGTVRVCFHKAVWASVPGILAVFAHNENEVVIYDLKAIPQTNDQPEPE